MKSLRYQKSVKVCQKIKNSRIIKLDYIHTKKNLTDPFTKRLSRNVIDIVFKEMTLRLA
jgi:hypothetical protein